MTVFLGKYSSDFEKQYFSKLDKNISPSYKNSLLVALNLMLNQRNQFATFKDLILADHDRLKECVDDLNENKKLEKWKQYKKLSKQIKKKDKNNNKKFKELEKEVEIFNTFFNYYDRKIKQNIDGIKLNLEILGQVHVCPYCNRDYINERNNKYPGGHLDHFFPRSKYPFFAICLYNLVPSCAICNTKKKEDNLKVSPFEENEMASNFKFEFELDGDIWEPSIVSLDEDIKNDLKILGLREAYKIHSDELTLLAKKREEYSRLYEAHLSKILEIDLNEIYISVEDLIFGEIRYYDAERYRNTPLSYLKHQFYNYIKSIHRDS